MRQTYEVRSAAVIRALAMLAALLLIGCSPPSALPIQQTAPTRDASAGAERVPTATTAVRITYLDNQGRQVPIPSPASTAEPIIPTTFAGAAPTDVAMNVPPSATPLPPQGVTSTSNFTERSAAKVTRVIDGDIIEIELDGRWETVRLSGLNTPESVDPRRPVECLGKEASAQMQTMTPPGTSVRVASDPTQDTRDQYGRVLLYVWLNDGTLINQEMIRLGYATEYTYRTAYQLQAAFRAAQQEAQDAERGLWAPNVCEGQPAVSQSENVPPAAAVPTSPSGASSRGVPPLSKDDCPPTHQIKGNQGSRSTEEWIYHPPGSRSYAVTDNEGAT